MYSINSHHCALKSNTTDHQLLSLWIAIETLLPPNNNESVIENFVSSISPFLGYEYTQKLIEDLRLSIKGLLTEEDYTEFLSRLPMELSETEKIALCVSLKEYDQLLIDLCRKFGKNSLLPNRIHQLTQKFRKTNDILKTLNDHDKRIIWQLKRIYRVRNLITHKGRPTEYVPRLLENTHFYYHTIINLISKNYQSDVHSLNSLEDIFSLIKFEHESHKKFLEAHTNVECDMDNFKNLLLWYH